MLWNRNSSYSLPPCPSPRLCWFSFALQVQPFIKIIFFSKSFCKNSLRLFSFCCVAQLAAAFTPAPMCSLGFQALPALNTTGFHAWGLHLDLWLSWLDTAGQFFKVTWTISLPVFACLRIFPYSFHSWRMLDWGLNSWPTNFPTQNPEKRDILIVPQLRPNAKGLGSIPGQGTRILKAATKSSSAATRTWHSHINE